MCELAVRVPRWRQIRAYGAFHRSAGSHVSNLHVEDIGGSMTRLRIGRSLATYAVVFAQAVSSFGCGDDDGGTSTGNPDSGSLPEGGAAAEGGSPDSGPRPDGGSLDSGPRPDGGPTIDGAIETPEGGSVLVDSQVPVDAGPTLGDSSTPAVGDIFGMSASGKLFVIQRSTGAVARSVAAQNLPAGETVLGADTRAADGTVIALSSAGKLYSVNTTDGTFTLKSTLAADPADTSSPFTALAGVSYAVDFNPTADRLRVVRNSGQNLRINVDSGAVTTDGPVNPSGPAPSAAAYTNSFAAACRTRLYVIDGEARKLYIQDPPNDGTLTEAATLATSTLGAVRTFELVTASDGSQLALVSDGSKLAELNLSNGALSTPRELALQGDTLVAVLAAPPASAPEQALGELVGTTLSNKVITFDRATPGKLCSSAAITGLAAGENVVGADIRPNGGALYVLTTANKLYTVQPKTGVATGVATLSKATDADPFTALSGTNFGVGFNPVADRLRVISNLGQNLRVNVDDGKVISDSAISQTAGTPGVTALAYTNSFAGARSTALWAIDSSSDSLVRVGGDPADGAACPNATNPNCGVSTTLLPLGVGDVAAVNGLDIAGHSGLVVAALSVGEAATSTLFTLNPQGNPSATPPVPVLTAIGVIGGGERLTSLSYSSDFRLTAWVVTAGGQLVSFAPNAPQTALTSAAITGLQAGETILGIDVRPDTAQLYALGSTGRLYTLAASGAASEVVALAAGTASSFTSLPDTTWGFDFNPVADALRLVGRGDQNLRVLPSTRAAGALGATFVDTALTPAGSNVVAAAYTRSVRNTPTTTLYVIGGATTTLYRQGGVGGTPSPNGGALTSVGALGVNSTADIGFDIVGGYDGLALAVIESGGAAALYSVNLASGQATAYNSANNTIVGTTGAVRGLALELK